MRSQFDATSADAQRCFRSSSTRGGARKGNEIGVVNIDGSGSHGTKFQLKDGDAEALWASVFVIRDDNVVEWVAVDGDQLTWLMEFSLKNVS